MGELFEVKTKELSGPALDWAVARAKGLNPEQWKLNEGMFAFSPSTSWSQGGPLIEKLKGMKVLGDKTIRDVTIEKLEHWYDSSEGLCRDWVVKLRHDTGVYSASGPTPLIAACRVIVTSVIGSAVSVPKELLK